MFYLCNSLTYIDLSNFNTQNVTNMHSMLCGCWSLTNINLTNFNTQNVTNMAQMFDGCCSLTSLDLSNFNTQKVTNMNWMFYYCKSLKYLNLSNFNTQNAGGYMGLMFEACLSLTKKNLITNDKRIILEFEGNEMNNYIYKNSLKIK